MIWFEFAGFSDKVSDLMPGSDSVGSRHPGQKRFNPVDYVRDFGQIHNLFIAIILVFSYLMIF
jgi:hypothetical protein